MSLLPEKELSAIEEWFSDVVDALGFAPNTDRGRVLKGIRKLKAEAADYEEEKSKVMRAYGYKRWGDLIRDCDSKLIATPEIELPEVFSSWPKLWVLREGGMLYDKAEKRVANETRQAVKKVWAHIATNEELMGAEWAEQQRAFFIEEFEASIEPYSFEQTCFAFITDYYGDEEEDPATTWVPIAEEAAAELEKANDLPTTAVEQLLAYAEEAEVEMTKQALAFMEESESVAKRFFDYLLTACLYKQSRVSREEVEKTSALVERALSCWGCYDPADNPSGCYKEVSAENPLHPSWTKRVYEPSISVEQIDAACRVVYKMEEEAKERTITHNEVEEAVREAVKQPEAGQALTTTEKN
jgi:hypothetical protein